MNDHDCFQLTTKQLVDNSLSFYRAIREGLKTNEGQLKCLPAYVSLNQSPSGKALVLDFGGTQLRAAVVSIVGNKVSFEKGPLSTDIPINRGSPLSKDHFLDIQTDLIKQLEPCPELPLGYCFSYPSRSESNGDARLTNWTKGIYVTGVAGKPLGKMLLNALAKKGIHCSQVIVINDAIASLLAGVAQQSADAYIGLIVGTGTNMATLIDPVLIQKLEQNNYFQNPLPVNLESGNFIPSCLTQWDFIVDNHSDNPGKQRFEKAVSGAYLGRLLKAMLPEETVNRDIDTKLISQWAVNSGSYDEKKRVLARLILERSAKLIASSLVGLLMFLNDQKHLRAALIIAEGGVILNAPDYINTVKHNVNRLIEILTPAIENTTIIRITHANLIGSALAAISHR